MKETDGATMQLGQDFLREQQEEEDKAYTLLQRVQLAGSKGEGILTIDSQLIG
jgi:ferritin